MDSQCSDIFIKVRYSVKVLEAKESSSSQLTPKIKN